MSAHDVVVYQDFEHEIIVVKGYIRWHSGSVTMCEHIVHPKNKEKAERIKRHMTTALTTLMDEMASEDTPRDADSITPN